MLNFTAQDRCFFTQQIFLIGTNNPDGSANFAPISWISFTVGKPCCLVISIGGDKQTTRNIIRDGKLSATLLTEELLPFSECCNKATQNNELYEKVCPQFERGKALDVPLICGSKWSYECSIINTVELSESHTFFAQVAGVNIADEIKQLDFLDLTQIKPVIYSPMHYFTVGEHLGRIGDFSKKDK